MNGGDILFFLLAAVCFGGGLGVVMSKNVVHSALFLLLSLIAVAGLFLLAFAEFLALVQVLIYGGAVTLLLLFALMLTRMRDFPGNLDNPQRPLALIVAVAVLLFLLAMVVATPWVSQEKELGEGVGLTVLAQSLFTNWVVPFEVASLVLLVALIGALIIARGGDRER